MKVLSFVLLILFSSNLYAPEVVIRPSERFTMSDLLSDERLKGSEQSYYMRCLGMLVTYIELMKEEFGFDMTYREHLAKEMYKIGLEKMNENLSHQNKIYNENTYNEYISQFVRIYKEDMLKNKETNGVFFIGDNYLNIDADICLDYEAPYRKFE
jgi:hypothetical protein